MEEQRHGISAPPGLVALVVYLRPAARRQLLSQLADLGFFVVEHQGTGGLREMAGASAADVALVLAPAGREHIALITELARHGARSVIVCQPDAADMRDYAESGALRCVTDKELGAGFVAVLTAAAAHARSVRLRPDDTGRPVVLGDFSFDPSLPALQREGRSRMLSQSERAVLLRLAAAAGRPVNGEDLERAATPPGTSIRPGFLKAIVLRIRRKIVDLGGDPELLRTVRGVGYVLGA